MWLLFHAVSGWSEHLPDALVDESVSVTENTEKIKKRYRKRKNKLEETFPAYLQVMLRFTLCSVVDERKRCDVLSFGKSFITLLMFYLF